MDETIRQRLEAAGINVEEALERFMGNEMLFQRFLKKFLEDESYRKLEESVQAGDPDGALKASHTLKGVCGNLSMNVLHGLLTEQVAAFRAGDWERAVSMMGDIAQAFSQVCSAVQSL